MRIVDGDPGWGWGTVLISTIGSFVDSGLNVRTFSIVNGYDSLCSCSGGFSNREGSGGISVIDTTGSNFGFESRSPRNVRTRNNGFTGNGEVSSSFLIGSSL